MVEITADLVKTLRDATNVSMMECKRALIDAGGDVERATKLLRERGVAVAAKRAGREAKQGKIASAQADGGKTVSLIELNCETDFVARNEDFRAFVDAMAQRAAQTDEDLAVAAKAELTAKIASVGENMLIRRHVRYVLQGPGAVGSYIHLGGKVGVLVELGCTKPETAARPEFVELVKDLTLHIAACSPRFVAAQDVPQAEIESEREIYAKQVQGKPAQIVGKIVDGKLKKFFTEVCLLDQEFVKEPKVPISTLLHDKGAALGETLTLRRFVRYQLGA